MLDLFKMICIEGERYVESETGIGCLAILIEAGQNAKTFWQCSLCF